MLPELTSQKIAIPAALFLALSPGVLVTTAGKNVKFMNGKTNQMAIFFHALVFFLPSPRVRVVSSSRDRPASPLR